MSVILTPDPTKREMLQTFEVLIEPNILYMCRVVFEVKVHPHAIIGILFGYVLCNKSLLHEALTL